MPFTNLQKGFKGGVVAPEFWGKNDLPQYATSLKTCENFKVTRAGSLSRCPGLEVVSRTPSDAKVRLFKFVLDRANGFLLEFSDRLIRFFWNGKLVENINLVSDYTIDELPSLDFRQINSVMYIVHPNHPPKKLVFGGLDALNVPMFSIDNAINIPSILPSGFKFQGSGGGSGNMELDYKVTIENLATGEESFPIPTLNVGGQNEIWWLTVDSSWTTPPDRGALRFIWKGIYSPQFLSDTTLSVGQELLDAQWGNSVVTLSMEGASGGDGIFEYMAITKKPLIFTFNGNSSGRREIINFNVDQGFGALLINFNTPTLHDVQQGWSGDIAISNITFHTDKPEYIEVTNSIPANTSLSDYNMSDGDQVIVYGTGIPLMDNRVFNIMTNGLAPNVYRIYTNPFGYGSVPSPVVGNSMPTALKLRGLAAIGSGNPVSLTWGNYGTTPNGYFPFQVAFNIYKGIGGVFGFIGTTQGHAFDDTGIPADITFAPPDYNPIFITPDDYPSSVECYQQRLVLAGTNKNPLEFSASRTGFPENFTTRYNLQPDDAIIRQSLEADAGASIQNLVNFGFLLVFTDQGEIVIKGDSSGTLTPVNTNTSPQTFNGAAKLRPIKINRSMLYVQAQTSLVRDLQALITPYGFTYIASSEEITTIAKHLVDGHSILDWDYQRVYDSIVWMAREDGVALGCTYNNEQQMNAWWTRTTDGLFENFCTVTEGQEDVVYACVARTFDGTTYRTIERMTSDMWTDIRDSNFLDMAYSLDGRNQASNVVIDVQTDATYLRDPANVFANPILDGQKYFVYGPDGYLVKCTPVAWTTTGALQVTTDRVVPANMIGVSLSWELATNYVPVDSFVYSGTMQLASTQDGKVSTNPLKGTSTGRGVVNGVQCAILPDYGVVNRVGLPYMSSFETLDYEDPKGDSFINKKTILKQCACMVKLNQGFWVGSDSPDTNKNSPQNKQGNTLPPNYTFGLTEAKIRESADYDEPTDLVTGRVLVSFAGTCEYGAGGYVRIIDPTPASFSSIGFLIESDSMGR